MIYVIGEADFETFKAMCWRRGLNFNWWLVENDVVILVDGP